MVDAIGANSVKKLRPDLELQKQQQAQKVQEKGKEPDVPKGVKEVSEAMAASQNDAVQYQAAPGNVEASSSMAPKDQMQTNVDAVKEADKVLNGDKLKTQDKTDKPEEAEKDKSLVAPEEKPDVGAVKTEDKTGKVKEDAPESVFKGPEPPKAPEKPEKPESKAEEKIKDPGKVDADIGADTEELLKRKERKGQPPPQ
jgi:hypothetical protein